MRRIASLAAAGLMAAAAIASPATAQAQTQSLELIKLLNGNIATANCDALRVGLTSTNMVGPDTTRSQLVSNVNNVVGTDATLRLVSASTVGACRPRFGVRHRQTRPGHPDGQVLRDELPDVLPGQLARDPQLHRRAALIQLRG